MRWPARWPEALGSAERARYGFRPRVLSSWRAIVHPVAWIGSTIMELAAADRAHLWHPFTQQRGWVEEEPLIVERGEGTDLIDVDGRRYIDGVSSLWCNVHGHAHPRIDAAVRDQLDRVAHSTMLGLSHRPGIELARRLAEIAPAGLTRVFYSDSGSTATEIALKMAFQYWRQRGHAERTKFVALRTASTVTLSGRCQWAGSTCSTPSTTRC